MKKFKANSNPLSSGLRPVKIDMVKAAEKGDKEHLFDLRMQILQGIDPFTSGAAELQLHHLEHNRKVMESFLKKNEV